MFTAKEFVVKVAASENDDWVLTESEIYARLTDAVGYTDKFWIESVKRLPLVGKVFTNTIPAIKEIRYLLRLNLFDAKQIVDAATAMGEFHLMGITITYDRNTGNYTVTDGR